MEDKLDTKTENLCNSKVISSVIHLYTLNQNFHNIYLDSELHFIMLLNVWDSHSKKIEIVIQMGQILLCDIRNFLFYFIFDHKFLLLFLE